MLLEIICKINLCVVGVVLEIMHPVCPVVSCRVATNPLHLSQSAASFKLPIKSMKLNVDIIIDF